MLGTPEFFAPEQIEGPKVGPAADLWSLGVTLFYALEGYSPFRRRGDQEPAATILAIVRDEPPRPQRQGPLADAILQLLRKEPSQRPTATQVASVLESILDKSPSPGQWRPSSTVNAFPRPGPDGHPRPRAGAQGAAKPHSPAPTKAEVNRLLGMPEREAAALLASYQPAMAGPLLRGMAVARPRTAASVLQILSSSQAAHAVDHLNPDIAADLLVAMPLSDAARILNRASVRTAAGVIMELPSSASAELVKAMRSERLAKVLEYVRPVIVADLVERVGEFSSTLLEQLSEPFREQVLRHLSRGRRVPARSRVSHALPSRAGSYDPAMDSRDAVVDVSNVCWSPHLPPVGRRMPLWHRLELVLAAWRELHGSRVRFTLVADESLVRVLDNVAEYRRLCNNGGIATHPVADSLILKLARDRGLHVITRDHYVDHRAGHPWIEKFS